MNWINESHIIRRGLLIIFTSLFIYITYRIFFDGIILDTFKLGAYYFFGGIILFMIKFYHDSRDKEEILIEPKAMVDIEKPVKSGL